MKISVVIPAHNEEKYIAETLEAILKQNYPDFEVIVVCNACTDKTEEIAKTFRVKIFNEQNIGTQWTRERGRKEAAGDLIASLDADCLPDTDWLRKAERYFKDQNIVAITGPYDYYDGSVFFRSISILVQKIFFPLFNKLFHYFKQGAILTAGNSIMRANALEKIGGYNTSILFYGDDTDTAKRLSAIGRIVFSNDLVMKSSARRFKKNGILKTFFLYLFYFFKVSLSNNKKPGL